MLIVSLILAAIVLQSALIYLRGWYLVYQIKQAIKKGGNREPNFKLIIKDLPLDVQEIIIRKRGIM